MLGCYIGNCAARLVMAQSAWLGGSEFLPLPQNTHLLPVEVQILYLIDQV